MRPFSFAAPHDIADVFAVLAERGSDARVLAGGQSLNLALKDRSTAPSQVVSIRHLQELRGIHHGKEGTLSIGAATTYAELAQAGLGGWHAELCRAAGDLADRSVRNIATIGGAACQAEPRYDVPALLVGCDASLQLASGDGVRLVPAAEFFVAGGGTCLRPSELLTRIVLPAQAAYTGVALEKFRYRAFEAAILIVVCAVAVEDGTARFARLTVGAVGKAPMLAHAASGALLGRRQGDPGLDGLADQVSREILPAEHQTSRLRQYQAELVKTLTVRAVKRAFEGGA